MTRVLVQAGAAALIRDNAGAAWLVPDPGAPDRTRLRERPISSWRPPGGTVVGGLLPRGAIRAVVVGRRGEEHEAATGDGAWIAALDQPMGGEPPPVRFHDAAGAIVRAPAPPGDAVDDASTACPACAAIAWEATARQAVCTVCGHAEQLGVGYAGGEAAALPPEQVERDRKSVV